MGASTTGGAGAPTPRNRPGGRGLATAATVTAGLLIVVVAVAPIVVKYLTNPPDQRLVDLDVYRAGGLAVLRGAPVYDFLTQPPQLLPFTYPPFAALLAAPIALAPWAVAQVLWVLAVYAALAVVIWYSFRDLIRRSGRWAPITMGVLVAASAHLMPVNDQIRFGQVGVFLMAMCVADCLTESPRWPRGMLIGLATAIKLVPGVFLIYLLITGRRQAAGNAIMTAAAVTLGSFTVLPWDSVDFWFGALLNSERAGANNATTNQSLNGMLLRLYWPGTVTTALWMLSLAVVASAGFLLARRASRVAAALSADLPTHGGQVSGAGQDPALRVRTPAARSAEAAGVAIVGLLSVLLSPIGWIHHLVWVVLVIGALVGDGRDPRRAAAAVAVWIYYLVPVPWWGSGMLAESDHPAVRFAGRLVQDGYGLGAVALMLVLGLWLLRTLSMRNDDGQPVQQVTRLGTLAR